MQSLIGAQKETVRRRLKWAEKYMKEMEVRMLPPSSPWRSAKDGDAFLVYAPVFKLYSASVAE